MNFYKKLRKTNKTKIDKELRKTWVQLERDTRYTVPHEKLYKKTSFREKLLGERSHNYARLLLLQNLLIFSSTTDGSQPSSGWVQTRYTSYIEAILFKISEMRTLRISHYVNLKYTGHTSPSSFFSIHVF